MWAMPEVIHPRRELPAQYFPDPQNPNAYTGPEFVYGITIPDDLATRAATRFGHVDPISPGYDLLMAVSLQLPHGYNLHNEGFAARIDLAWRAPDDKVLTYYTNLDRHMFDAEVLQRMQEVLEWMKEVLDDDLVEVGWYLSLFWCVEDTVPAGEDTANAGEDAENAGESEGQDAGETSGWAEA